MACTTRRENDKDGKVFKHSFKDLTLKGILDLAITAYSS
jgi:hypothetical protein